MSDAISGKFKRAAIPEHRICQVRYFMGNAQTLITTERDNKSVCSRKVISLFFAYLRTIP